MMGSDALLDAFINANILFFVGYALWLLVRAALWTIGIRNTYGPLLRLLNVFFVTILCAPLIAMVFSMLQSSGVARHVNPNLSDMVVAYYLNGGFQMEPSRFEQLVMLRDSFALNVLNAEGLAAQVAIAAFLFGVAWGLFRLLRSIYCLLGIVRNSYAWRSFGRIRIRLSDGIIVPFSTRGLWNYYVIIPSHMLGKNEELKVALAHEFQHIRQGDLEWEIALEALKPLFLLNPAYRIWKRQVEHLRELNCDTKVLALGRINVRTYCETLLSVGQRSLRNDRAFVMAIPKVTLVTAGRSSRITGKRCFLEHRVLSAIECVGSRNDRVLFAAVAVPLLAVLTLTTLAIQSPGDWSHDRLMLSTVVNLERLEEINRLSTFGRP